MIARLKLEQGVHGVPEALVCDFSYIVSGEKCYFHVDGRNEIDLLLDDLQNRTKLVKLR